jgi:hypothetical protein
MSGFDELRLKEKHTWRSRPGYKICVLDRGAVRFDFPARWKVDTNEGAVMLHDGEPGIETCDLGVSLFHVPGLALADVPLEELLENSLGSERAVTRQSEMIRVERGDTLILWLEQEYMESTQKRPAKFRVAIARSPELHCLISMNYWAKRAPTLEPVWNEVLRTLTLGEYVKDPLAGPMVQ